jgi:hypothetical protein
MRVHACITWTRQGARLGKSSLGDGLAAAATRRRAELACSVAACQPGEGLCMWLLTLLVFGGKRRLHAGVAVVAWRVLEVKPRLLLSSSVTNEHPRQPRVTSFDAHRCLLGSIASSGGGIVQHR